MGDSNGAWGQLAEHDDERAEVWDKLAPIPEPGENPALDAFVARKHLTHASLVRVGTRMAAYDVLAFAGPGYIKYRNVVNDQRWSYPDCDWSKLRIIRAGAAQARTVLVSEGESDSARLTDAYAPSGADVAILPAGAGYFPSGYAAQLSSYELVLAALDTDEAGERGAQHIVTTIPQAQRFAPPANDWCAVDPDDLPPLPSPEDFSDQIEMKVLVSAGEMLDLEPPTMISWFEQAVLPVGGQLILHGWAKSYKSFLTMDLLASLSQGEDWCGFEPAEEPCTVALLQYEIPWAFMQSRIRLLHANARKPDLFDSNFLAFTPMRRPTFVAGNVAQEDAMLMALETHHVQVFCLDPIRRATGSADLNSEKDVRPLLNFFARLQDNGITVISCHHDNKTYSRQGGGDPLGMTGVGAFAGDADTIVSVSLPKGVTIEEPVRNLRFTTRNAPTIGSRGMRMTDAGMLVYSTTPHGLEDDRDEPAPTTPADPALPAI